MSFEAFDTKKMDEYRKEAKAKWGDTSAYREFEQKSEGRSKNEEQDLSLALMSIFSEFGKIRAGSPEGEAAMALVKKLQNFITQNYYSCTDEILLSLGSMYAGGGEMTENIDKAGGQGTGEFAKKAIEASKNKKNGQTNDS